ncbi:hypothetical protein JNUCC0626_48305 [Lentzea sp. JNUCC 0626]|uniref:hypothetical protein n=1 Tax=Lentzea sp. JNUCC 0626 TaxID=3367513 RepID=UPI0037496AFC
MRWGSSRWGTLRDHSYRDHFPSADEGVEFTVALTVQARVAERRSRPPEDPLDRVALAADQIIRPVAAGIGALRCEYLQHAIGAEIADLQSLSDRHVRIANVFVRVRLDDAAAVRAREVQRMRHELELDELARQQARARARFIRDECLADPATARIYGLLEKSSRLGELAGVLDQEDLVEQISAWHEPARAVLIAQGVIGFLGRLKPQQSFDILDRFIPLVRAYGGNELADRLQELNVSPDT